MSHYVPAADARIAASLLLLRDGDRGVEVLMMRRAERHGDMRSGVAVFPGGVVDPRDRQGRDWILGPGDDERSRHMGLAEGGLDYVVAALRESFEEVGLLLAVAADGSPFDAVAQGQALHPWRDRLNRSDVGVADFCAHFDIRLDGRGLAYHSHWLTPPGAPKRFDTRFFCALAPEGQQASADLGEAQELMWLTPGDALQPERGLKLLPVTRCTLQDLARFGSAADAHAEAGQRRVFKLYMPRFARTGQGGPCIVLPDERPYAEIGRLDPEGRGDASAEIVPGRAVTLSPRVRRVTAPNAGPMTGPGTNTYLVACPQTGRWTVIDPGPVDDTHLKAILEAAGGPIERILVTHTHRDHSPGAAALAAATGAPVLGRIASDPTWQDPEFAPSAQPADGDRLVLGPDATLQVLHTPGHASNHLCFLLEQEKLLFTGDHVMQGSTVVINPPDGDMSAYLRSLKALMERDLQWLAPGHGFLVAEPRAVLQALIDHRLRREAKVLKALERLAPCSLDELLPQVYDDVPASLHALARRSLLAHLLKLRDDGVAEAHDARWSLRGEPVVSAA